jgi:chromosome segregation ATPase
VSDENLEQRVTAVEAEVVELRRETAAARALAAGADRDVADYHAHLRAHTRGLAALRQTQIEHHAEHKAEFAKVGAQFAKIDDSFAQVGAQFAKIDYSFAQVGAEFAKIDTSFAQVGTTIARVEAGLQHIVHLLERPDDGAGTPAPAS